MLDFIMIPLIVGIITLGIYKLFELFARRKERLTIIEKMGEKFDPSMIENPFTFSIKTRGDSAFGTLKIACLLLGVGLGLLVGFLILINTLGCYAPNGEYNWQYNQQAGVIYGATVLLFGGLGLLVAFLIELYHNKKAVK